MLIANILLLLQEMRSHRCTILRQTKQIAKTRRPSLAGQPEYEANS